ncbi:unnamed protein product [Closterium sp. Naga37s-1]|nr:unnamed protein product [Closterium sp. Naga37s-1]
MFPGAAQGGGGPEGGARVSAHAGHDLVVAPPADIRVEVFSRHAPFCEVLGCSTVLVDASWSTGGGVERVEIGDKDVDEREEEEREEEEWEEEEREEEEREEEEREEEEREEEEKEKVEREEEEREEEEREEEEREEEEREEEEGSQNKTHRRGDVVGGDGVAHIEQAEGLLHVLATPQPTTPTLTVDTLVMESPTLSRQKASFTSLPPGGSWGKFLK